MVCTVCLTLFFSFHTIIHKYLSNVSVVCVKLRIRDWFLTNSLDYHNSSDMLIFGNRIMFVSDFLCFTYIMYNVSSALIITNNLSYITYIISSTILYFDFCHIYVRVYLSFCILSFTDKATTHG